MFHTFMRETTNDCAVSSQYFYVISKQYFLQYFIVIVFKIITKKVISFAVMCVDHINVSFWININITYSVLVLTSFTLAISTKNIYVTIVTLKCLDKVFLFFYYY